MLEWAGHMDSGIGRCRRARSLVSGYSAIAQSLVLPDPNDQHVLAAAIGGDADAIVTFNLADFPDAVLRGHDLEAIHPDDFLICHFELSPDRFLDAVRRDRGSLKNPPVLPRNT
jgi:hypothetical protein